MGRRLPEYDPERDGDYARSKRRIQLFKRVYQNYFHWKSLRETGGVGDVLSVDGEEIYLGDLMTGIETLPLRQRQAFELICLRGYTESAATAILLPNSRWSTPVQQYSDDGLRKMVLAYDAKQDGTWDPVDARRKAKKARWQPCGDTPKEQESVAVPIRGCSVPAETTQDRDADDEPNDDPALKSAPEHAPDADHDDTGAQGG
jgi:hypothetical protein